MHNFNLTIRIEKYHSDSICPISTANLFQRGTTVILWKKIEMKHLKIKIPHHLDILNENLAQTELQE